MQISIGQKKRMISAARKKWGKIHPLPHRNSLENCFTEMLGKAVFWFNTNDKSTHLIKEEISC